MSVNEFISQFSGYSEEYKFYQGTVTLRYEPKNHIYYRVMADGTLVPQSGVTDTVGIIDKSNFLVPWAVKVMAAKILETVPRDGIDPDHFIAPMSYSEFEGLVLAAKSAHKEKVDQASLVGNIAHNWIESLINYELNSHSTAYLQLPTNSQAKSCCQAAIRWMEVHNVRWIHTEKKVYSLQYCFAGTIDGLCRCDSCDDRQCCRTEFKDRLSLVDWKSSNALQIGYLLQTAAYLFAYQEEHGVKIDSRWVIRLGKEDGEFEPWHIENLSQDWWAFLYALHLSRAVDGITQRMKEYEALLKQERKAEKQQAREAALAIACKGSSKYQGKRRPVCNNGNPCQSCITKYRQVSKRELQ